MRWLRLQSIRYAFVGLVGWFSGAQVAKDGYKGRAHGDPAQLFGKQVCVLVRERCASAPGRLSFLY